MERGWSQPHVASEGVTAAWLGVYIGYKRGTGGTSGVAYLTRAVELRFFPEFRMVRTWL